MKLHTKRTDLPLIVLASSWIGLSLAVVTSAFTLVIIEPFLNWNSMKEAAAKEALFYWPIFAVINTALWIGMRLLMMRIGVTTKLSIGKGLALRLFIGGALLFVFGICQIVLDAQLKRADLIQGVPPELSSDAYAILGSPIVPLLAMVLFIPWHLLVAWSRRLSSAS